MLYHLLYPLHTTFTVFNVFRYITFRTIYASLTAFFICFLLGPWMIRKLAQMQVGQYIRDDGPKTHLGKAGTPTMGGTLILLSITVSVLLWSDLTNLFVWIVLFVLLGFGLIGFIDDYLMQVKKQSKGLTVRRKLLLQVIVALITGILVYASPNFSTQVTIPFFKNISPDFAWGYIIFAIFVIVGASNLREELAIFESMLSAESRAANPLSINRFKVVPDVLPGEYRYRLLLLLAPGNRRDRDFQGRLELVVSLTEGGKNAMMTFPEPGDPSAAAFRLSFRHFHRVEGIFRVDPKAKVESVQVRVYEGGSDQIKAAQTASPG